MTSKKPAAAGMREIRKILGSVDDDIVAAIRGTGASPAEILHAQILVEDGGGKNAGGIPLYGRLGRVYDILEQDRQDDDPGRDGQSRLS